MRFYLLIALAAVLALVSAMPITPSAPHLQKRAEQFRLQGLREFEIASRLMESEANPTAADLDPWRIRLNNKFHALFDSSATGEDILDQDIDDEEQDFSGDVAPGSMEAPSYRVKASEKDSLLDRMCALFRGKESSFGYEGKEGELRRPTGERDWKKSFGGFRR